MEYEDSRNQPTPCFHLQVLHQSPLRKKIDYGMKQVPPINVVISHDEPLVARKSHLNEKVKTVTCAYSCSCLVLSINPEWMTDSAKAKLLLHYLVSSTPIQGGRILEDRQQARGLSILAITSSSGAPERTGGFQLDRCKSCGEPERVFNRMIQPTCQVRSHNSVAATHPAPGAPVSKFRECGFSLAPSQRPL